MAYCEPPQIKDEITELGELFVDGRGENSNQTTATGIFLSKDEKELFSAVGRGDTDLVKTKLSNNQVNVNAINSDGDTALQIAAENKNIDIMKVLLNEGADLKIALLQCVLENDLECVKVLLSGKPPDIGISGDCYITPTILAAQLGHYEIVHFLVQNNYLIERPHVCTNSEECKKEKCNEKSDMLRSQIAIHRYRGLTSPVYMCLSYLDEKGTDNDPLTQAFKLNKEVQNRAMDERELKKEYLKLSERCKTFATDLYNGCRSMEEIAALLDIDEKKFNLSSDKKVDKESRSSVVKKLRKAIKSNHEEFVAHPHTQQLINMVVYSGVPKWIFTGFFFRKSLLFILYTVLFPVLAFLYILFPWLDVPSQMMSTPFMKFVSHISQFLVFLALLAAASLRDNHSPTGIEFLIFIIVLGMIVQEFNEMLHHRPWYNYFLKWWNIITTIMLLFFVFAALLWLIGYAITGGWSVRDYSLKEFTQNKHGYQLLLVGNSFFSLGIVVSVFHLVDLCQVSSVLGPLQLSLYRMLQDVLKFLLFFAAIFVAFVMGLRNLYSYYNSIQAEIAENGGRNDSISAETNHPFSTFSKSTASMFWALFDKIDLEDFETKDRTFEITEETGKVLFAFYSICAVMVALNMLIAMMSHSYEYISQDEDIQWKFSRTQLWLEFVAKGSTLPSPYNLIPNPRAIYHFFTRKPTCGCGTDEIDCKTDQAKRKKIINRLVRRYFRNQKSLRNREFATLKDIEDGKEEIIRILKEHSNETVEF